jgi:hypothetical protein
LGWHDNIGDGDNGNLAFESGPTRMVWSPDCFTESYVPLGQ